MRIFKRIALSIICLMALPIHAQIGMEQLSDSLTHWTGFSSLWSASVKVKSMRVNGNKITIRTNKTLKDVRWTNEKVTEIKRSVSRWILGHEKGNVTIQVGRVPIEQFITHCAKGIYAHSEQHDLTDRHIVLYPSHGLYYNKLRNEWIWQRATLWTTVEDLYSMEYVRLIKRMIENAGGMVYMPRAQLEEQNIGVSGMPQWTEGARYWLISQGADSTLWDLFDGDEYKDDMKCRGMWINSLQEPIDLSIALHTDGIDSQDDSTIVGTLVIYTAYNDEKRTQLRDGRDRETVNRNFADWIQTQVTQDLRAIAPEWTRRQLKEANYCESRMPDVPGIILELLSHKNMADMRYGLDPKFRFAASRAVYKGILRYLNGSDAIVQPLPIQHLRIHADGLLEWKASIDSLEPMATPTYYMVYSRENDGEWDVQHIEGLSCQMNLKPGIRYTYYVVAGNDGGLSFPSPEVSAYLSEEDHAPTALIVDAFDDAYGVDWFADSIHAGIVPGSFACEDYFSCAYIGQQWNYTRSDMWQDDDNCGWGACYRDHAGQITIGNTHDWAVQHGRILRRMRISYISCTGQMIDSTWLQTDSIQLIDWVSGRQRVPLNAQQQDLLAAFLERGGKLLMSTDHLSAINPSWTAQYLHAQYYAAQATHSGRVLNPWHRVYQMLLEPNADQLFTCHPEGLKPVGDQAQKMATYEDMRCPAAVGYQHQTLVYGFPLETVVEYDKLYRHSIEWLLNKNLDF